MGFSKLRIRTFVKKKCLILKRLARCFKKDRLDVHFWTGVPDKSTRGDYESRQDETLGGCERHLHHDPAAAGASVIPELRAEIILDGLGRFDGDAEFDSDPAGRNADADRNADTHASGNSDGNTDADASGNSDRDADPSGNAHADTDAERELQHDRPIGSNEHEHGDRILGVLHG